MLMPRHQVSMPVPTNHNLRRNHMTIALQHQQHHINQLLTTAAAGTGVVGDVDGIVPTTHRQAIDTKACAESKRERNLWRMDEIHQALTIMQQVNAIERLNDKAEKSENVFLDVEKLMRQNGFQKKTHNQIWTKWKFLKSTYTTSKRNGIVPKVIPPPIYAELQKMLSAGGGGGSASECDNSRTSQDGDDTNGERSNGKLKGDTSEEEQGFGVAHPIFGFRLGTVKTEPVDAGYETINNGKLGDSHEDIHGNSSRSSTPNTHNDVEIKQEREEFNEPIKQLEKRPCATEIMVHRRAPRHSAAATMAVNPIPPLNKVANPACPQLPALRIAPFAKAPSENALMRSTPPPLTMPQAPMRGQRAVNLYNNSNFIQPRAILPRPPAQQPQSVPSPAPAQHVLRPVRLTKNMTMMQPQPITPPMGSMDMLRMRHKNPYALRGENVMLPNISSSSYPPTMQPPPPFGIYASTEMPSTSQQALQVMRNKTLQHPVPPHAYPAKKRKRRLPLPPISTQPADKRTRAGSYAQQVPNPTQYSFEHDSEDEDTDDEDTKEAHHETSGKPKGKPQTNEQIHRERKLFENALKMFSDSMLQMQREMMKKFFDAQMELVRKDHEFQMQQDEKIIQAFQEQTEFMKKWARDSLGICVNGEKVQVTKEATNKIEQLTGKVGSTAAPEAAVSPKRMAKSRNAVCNEMAIGHNKQRRIYENGNYAKEDTNELRDGDDERQQAGEDNVVVAEAEAGTDGERVQTTGLGNELAGTDTDDSDESDSDDSSGDTDSDSDGDQLDGTEATTTNDTHFYEQQQEHEQATDEHDDDEEDEDDDDGDGDDDDDDNDNPNKYYDSVTDPTQLVTSELVEEY